jgi:gamma-glutamyl:cysteine ligase YbdK (ATP-grasp superfamily)
MGIEIERERFDEADVPPFRERLETGLSALEALLRRPGFGRGAPSIGAELELYLVGPDERPLAINREVQEACGDPRVALELNRFNLECDLRPVPLAGRPFSGLEEEMRSALDLVRRAAAARGAEVVMIGILPTLREGDLRRSAMTDSARFRALSAGLLRLRGEPLRLRVDGEEPLEMLCDDVTFEGGATSLQIHLRTDPGDFAPTFNAVQLATAPVLAACGNSPILLGRALWEETRIVLFKHAVDDRSEARRRAGHLPRVELGGGWLRDGPLELFEQGVRLHEPLLPVVGDEDVMACVEAGGVPRLEELRLHLGTVWHWNRGVYDPALGGHLRIEMRALPAGPTPIDMLANTAVLVGLALGLAPEIDAWTRALAFEEARTNFYRAAQHGLAASLVFPPRPGAAPAERNARDLLLNFLPLAQRGLESAGVEREEAESLLQVIRERVERGRTGAAWQRRALRAARARLAPEAALAELVARYHRHSASGEPVHRWPEWDGEWDAAE